MLVLTRKRDESVMIGNDILVVVGKVSGGRVKLRVTAPRQVTVVRGELAARQQQEVDASKSVGR
jgi:carbon storage regulator